MLLALTLTAFADSITLDTGVTIEGDLARYEFGGDCQISVTEGELRGVILIVPCHRVEAFVRTTPAVPTPIGLTSVAPREPAPTPAAAPAVAEMSADPGPATETVPLAAAAPIEESEPVAPAPVPLGAPRPAPAMGDVDDESPPDAETARRAVSF